jgi:hypothetical protein
MLDSVLWYGGYSVIRQLAPQEKTNVESGKSQASTSARRGCIRAKAEHLSLQSMHLRELPVLTLGY